MVGSRAGYWKIRKRKITRWVSRTIWSKGVWAAQYSLYMVSSSLVLLELKNMKMNDGGQNFCYSIGNPAKSKIPYIPYMPQKWSQFNCMTLSWWPCHKIVSVTSRVSMILDNDKNRVLPVSVHHPLIHVGIHPWLRVVHTLGKLRWFLHGVQTNHRFVHIYEVWCNSCNSTLETHHNTDYEVHRKSVL